MRPDGPSDSTRQRPLPGNCDLSVVIPVFDEEASVELLHREIVAALKGVTDDYEVIFVNDGSRDRTLPKLRSLCAKDPRVRAFSFNRNFGQSAALQVGFDYAIGRIVVTMDGDLQSDPADIGPLVHKLNEGYDVVSGWRKLRKDRFLTRRVPSMAANWLIGRVTGIRIHDNGCTLKAYRQEVVKRTRIYAEMHRFLVPILSLSGCRITEEVVNHRPRLHGRSKYGLSRIWKVFLDLVAVKMLLRFASHPAAWFAVLAFPFVLAAVAAAVGLLVVSATAAGTGEPAVVLPSIAILAAFAAAYLLLAGMFAELVVRFGDFQESGPILTTVEIRKGD